jgi:hypothetical protein
MDIPIESTIDSFKNLHWFAQLLIVISIVGIFLWINSKIGMRTSKEAT